MPSQWLAVGAETDPRTRARELQESWEHLLADGALGLELPPEAVAGLRTTIVDSWRRSLATGLDPMGSLAPIEADESEVLERWFEHPRSSLTEGLLDRLRQVADESRSVVVVTDASGLVLHRTGDEWLKERAAEMNLVEGARWHEAAAGTNGIGSALSADHAFQVFAFEHFNDAYHEWICSGAPVHDPVSGEVVGLIDLSNLWKDARPRSFELAKTAARAIERCLSTSPTAEARSFSATGRSPRLRRWGRARPTFSAGSPPACPSPHRSRCSSVPKGTFASSSPSSPPCGRSRPSLHASPPPISCLPRSPSRSRASSPSST